MTSGGAVDSGDCVRSVPRSSDRISRSELGLRRSTQIRPDFERWPLPPRPPREKAPDAFGSTRGAGSRTSPKWGEPSKWTMGLGVRDVLDPVDPERRWVADGRAGCVGL